MNGCPISRPVIMTGKGLFLMVVFVAVQAHSYSNSHVHPPSSSDADVLTLDRSGGQMKHLPVAEKRNSISTIIDGAALQESVIAGSDESFSSKLRRDLLANYDRGAYPWEYAWSASATGIRQGVPVGLDIVFHKVFEVDVVSSAADLVVWFREEWTDPRLRWNPEDYGGMNSTWFWIGYGSGSAGETSEIWTPDLKLWNQRISLDQSLVDAHARVTSDGDVFWSRPGHLKPVCRFSGLKHFPFDELQCTIEIGSWAYSGLYLRPQKLREGFSIGGSETAGEAYAEYVLLDVRCDEHLYPPYPGAPEEDWPVMLYYLTFKRAWEPYARSYITLQIVLNLAAFCCFWLPPHIGERMSLGITSLLAAVASELVVSSNLPRASEMTWVSKFSMVSLLFAAMAVFESAAVIYFYYHTGSSLRPIWFQELIRKCSSPNSRKKLSKDDADEALEEQDNFEVGNNVDVSGGSSGVNSLPAGDAEENRDKEQSKETPSIFSFGNDSNSQAGEVKEDDAEEKSKFMPVTSMMENKSSQQANKRRVQFSQRRRSSLEDESSETRQFAHKITESTRTTLKVLLGRDAEDFKNAEEMKNNIRWQKVSKQIDDIARVLFPIAYSIFIAVVFTGDAFDL